MVQLQEAVKDMPRKLAIRLGSVGIAIRLITALLVIFIPARLNVTGEGRLSLTFDYKVYASPATQTKYPNPTDIVTVEEDPYSNNNWTTPENVGADDAAYASITTPTFDSPDYSYIIKALGFGFTIPANSTINGITVEVERYADAAEGLGKDALVQLYQAGARQGSNYADTVNDWDTAPTIKSYGGATDLWGLTWTVDQINAADFGVALAAQATTINADIYVDFVRITVDYTPPPADISNTPNNWNLGTVIADSFYETELNNFTVTNNSAYPVTITISGDNMTGGDTPWILSDTATPGPDTYGLIAGLEGGSYNITVPQSFANTLVGNLSNVSPDNSQKWGLQFWAPTSFDEYGVSKSANVTLTATQP